MTQLRSDRAVRRETACCYRGRPLIVELHPGYMTIREKGRRRSVLLDYRAAFDLACKILARERLAEKKGKGKQ